MLKIKLFYRNQTETEVSKAIKTIYENIKVSLPSMKEPVINLKENDEKFQECSCLL